MHACDAVDEARDLAGWEPPPELDAAIVTEVDGLPLMLNPSSTTGYKHVTRRLNMTYRVAPPDSFPANTRRFLKGATYATALEAASDIVRKVTKERERVAAVNKVQKEQKAAAKNKLG